jgi:hypothetical protein
MRVPADRGDSQRIPATGGGGGGPALPEPALDYSEVRLGAARAAFGQVSARAGELNLGSHNLKLGVTAQPRRMAAGLAGPRPWRAMRLLWATRSPDQAREMAGLLRAWDRKLFADDPELSGPEDWPAATYYAFGLVR